MHRKAKPSIRLGLTLMEVMIALVILGFISTAYMVTSNFSRKNTGKAIDWQAESVAIEKTVERLRLIHSVTALRGYKTPWIDSTSKVRINVSVNGGAPPASVCENYCDSVAMITITAKRQSFNDSITVTTYLFAKNP